MVNLIFLRTLKAGFHVTGNHSSKIVLVNYLLLKILFTKDKYLKDFEMVLEKGYTQRVMFTKDLIKMERDQVLEFVNLKRQVLFIKGNGEMTNRKEMEFSLLYRMKLLKQDLKALK